MQKRELTREGILDAYIELLEEKNFDKVTVKALCTQAGIVRSTFYTYFDDIYEVIQTIEDDLISAFARVDADSRGREAREEDIKGFGDAHTDWGFPMAPPAGFCEWFDCCEEHRTYLRAMLGPHGDPYFEEKFRRVLTKHVNFLMDSDDMPNDTLRTGFVEAFVEVHTLLTKNWLLHEHTSLNKDRIGTILNSMRVGANTMGYYLDEETTGYLSL